MYEIDKDSIDIKWSLAIESEKRIKIIFNFDPENLVSTDGLDPDYINMIVTRPQIFVAKESGLTALVLK